MRPLGYFPCISMTKHFKIISALLIQACLFLNPAVSGQGTDSLSLQLNRFLDRWHHAAAEADHDAYIGAMTANGVYIGTDATERWTTAEFSTWSKPWFDRKRTWNFRAVDRHIDLASDNLTAWFDELLDTQMGLCRGSGVLVKQAGAWKIAQYVLSPTVPNDLINRVTALKGASDTALMLQQIFDRHELTGTILLYDPARSRYSGYNPALWDSGYLPASTFKIPNTLIGLETGVIDTAYVFRWNGKHRRFPQWETDLTLAEAFRVSCVPCYQELARKTGPARMREYLSRIGYPGMDVTAANIDLFWLEGESRITPRQQAEFLQRLNEEKLPVKPSVMLSMKRIMVNEQGEDYTLYGKTGWAIRNGNNYGWFVGWLTTGKGTVYLATLVMPKSGELPSDFTAARKLVTMEALRLTGWLKSPEKQ